MRCNLTDLENGHIIWLKLDILKFGLKTNGLYLLGYRDEPCTGTSYSQQEHGVLSRPIINTITEAMNVLIVKIIVYDLHVNNHVAFLLNYPVYHIKNKKKID